MTKNSNPYAVTRTNAMKFGVTVNRPMTCPGRHRCRYRYCDDLSFEPSAGDECPWEVSYASALEASYRRTYDFPAMREQIADLDGVIETLVANGLKRNRISFRSNRTLSAGDIVNALEIWDEFKLCDRYFTACLRELHAILQRMEQALRHISCKTEEIHRCRLCVMPD